MKHLAKEVLALSFNSLIFFLFFPVTAAASFLLPRKWQNSVLLAASWIFYAFTTPQWLWLLILQSVAVWLLVLWMSRGRGSSRKRRLIVCLSITLGLLAGLRLTGFAFAGGVSLLMPLGISFFTLQAAGYALDVYHERCAPEHSWTSVSLFVSFFCCIASGPILRADPFFRQLKAPRRFDPTRAPHALLMIAQGYLFKVAIADLLAVYVNAVFGSITSYHGLTLTAAALGYALQLYFDFSGYSLLAQGFAALLGLEIPQNFNTPYFSRSIREFWSRWHISLSRWLRDYVYIPLGGSHKGRPRLLCNIMLTFFVSGLWHGTGATYLIWGLLHGIYRVCSLTLKPFLAQRLPMRSLCRHSRLCSAGQCVFTFFCINFAWVFFRAQTASDAFYLLTHQFQNISVEGFLHDLISIWNNTLQTTLLVYAALAFLFISLCAGISIDVIHRFYSPQGNFAAWLLSRKAPVRWLIYYTLAGLVFGGFLLNNGYFSTAASFLYNNF